MQFGINASYYTDPAIYTAERRSIFASNWWLLGPAATCESAGSYCSDTICGWPIFALRDSTGELRGFHNVCRHRGSILLESGQGQCARIRCPYHGWLYGQDGVLQKTAGFGEISDQQLQSLNLWPVDVRQWRGMLFVRPQPAADPDADFAAWLGRLDELYQTMPDLSQMEYYGQFVVEGEANWKTYCDNTVEGYHLHSVHPRLAKAVAAGNVQIVPYDNSSLVAFHVDYGAAAGGAELRGNDGLWTYKFPGFQIAASDNAFKIERLEPIGHTGLRSTNWAWYRNLHADQKLDSFEWSRKVVEEDIGICEKVQANLNAGVFVNGPLSADKEHCVAGLQAFYRQVLQRDSTIDN